MGQFIKILCRTECLTMITTLYKIEEPVLEIGVLKGLIFWHFT